MRDRREQDLRGLHFQYDAIDAQAQCLPCLFRFIHRAQQDDLDRRLSGSQSADDGREIPGHFAIHDDEIRAVLHDQFVGIHVTGQPLHESNPFL